MTVFARLLSHFQYFGIILLLAGQSLAQAAGQVPPAPSNLQGSVVDGLATLSWDIPEDDDAIVGYNIYVDGAYADTVFTNSYSVAIEPETLYLFSIVAFDEEPQNYSPASATLALPAELLPEDLTIPPSVPVGLSGEVSETTVTLSWQPSTDDEGVRGYNIYKDNQYLATVLTPTFTGEVEAGAVHAWSVVAFDIRNNFSAPSEALVLPDQGPVDTTQSPSAPVGLVAQLTSGVEQDTVELSWEASTDDRGVAGYNVYQNRSYLTTVFDTSYTVLVSSGSTNIFQVVAFDFDGNFSAASDGLTVPDGEQSANPGVPPSAPQQLSIEAETVDGNTVVLLQWVPSTGPAPVAGYNVYRNNDYLTTVFTNAYTDTVAAGEAYSYRVVAFDNFENYSASSAPVSVLAEANQPPFFSDLDDQNLNVGVFWELLLRPIDIDGMGGGILVSELPAGMQLVDNMDGSQSLQWTPTEADIGVYPITITAFDLQDTDLRTSQVINVTVDAGEPPMASSLAVQVQAGAYNLVEGNPAGLDILVMVSRDAENTEPVSLSIQPESDEDAHNLSANFSVESVTEQQGVSMLNLQLGVDVLPIQPGQRSFTVIASDGVNTATDTVTVAVTPVPLDDVYLMIGQSNMVGLSEEGAKQGSIGEPDAFNLRIRQANVQLNDSALYLSDDSYTDTTTDFLTPAYVLAEDPLHTPVDPVTLDKSGSRIGMPLSFAKAALPDTTRSIVLVPAAWSSSAFCESAAAAANWNALPTDNPVLGDTLLFDRALARINKTLRDTGGILRGIVWLQGESDSNEECAEFYEQNLVLMVSELRSRIIEDARGASARGPDANIPFVAGTMSRGADERGDLSLFDPAKQLVDGVHRSIATLIAHGEVVVNDDLIPANGYPCGEGSCIHFGAAALREMGPRAYEALLRAASEPR